MEMYSTAEIVGMFQNSGDHTFFFNINVNGILY